LWKSTSTPLQAKRTGTALQHRSDAANPHHPPASEGARPGTVAGSLGANSIMGERPVCCCQHDQREIGNSEHQVLVPRCVAISPLPDSRRRVLRVVATRSCMCDCPASTTRPDLPSHWQYPTRYGDSVTTRLEALGQCIPPSQDGYRIREGTIFLPASRRIGARVSGRVSRCEPL
jgi:hypothetical protein